jgi:uncharacterized protein YqeY
MSEQGLKYSLQEARKTALRAQAKDSLSTLGLILAAIKQKEVDERIVLNDEQILGILDKMVRQRRESIEQFQNAKRLDLVQKEEAELALIQEFLPQALTPEEIQNALKSAILQVGAQNIRDMSKVMEIVKPQFLGRADMGMVGRLLKEALS